jgi:hypothetical protein
MIFQSPHPGILSEIGSSASAMNFRMQDFLHAAFVHAFRLFCYFYLNKPDKSALLETGHFV